MDELKEQNADKIIKTLDTPGKGLLRAAGAIIVVMAAISIIITLLGGNYMWSAFAAIFSLATGILCISTKGCAKISRVIFAFGIINLIALPFAMAFAAINLMFTSAEGMLAMMSMLLPSAFMFLFLISFAANVMLLVGAIYNIKAARR